MSPTEIDVHGEQSLRQTHVEGGYVVSTIRRDDSLQALDGMLEMMTAIVGDIGRADLSAEGEYETMVFPGTAKAGISNWTELDFQRYDSEEEARAGHEAMVEKWKEMPAGITRKREDDD